MTGQHIIIQGHFLHHPFSGQGVFTEEMLRVWNTEDANTYTVLLWYRTKEQCDALEKVMGQFPRMQAVYCAFPSWMPLRIALGWWETVWIPWFLQCRKNEHHYFSPTLHAMLWHPKQQTKTLQMILHDTFQFTEKAYTQKWTRKLYNQLLLRTARHKSVQLWTVSQTSKEAIQRALVPWKEVYVAGNGIDHLLRTEPAPWGEVAKQFGVTKPYIVYQGGYDVRKNVPALLKVFRDLKQTIPQLQLVLCGNSLHASALYDNVQSHAMEDGIIHTGFISRAVLRTLLAHAAFLASPARAEGFNINIGEALMEGTAVIASDIPVHRELWGKYTFLTDFADESATKALFSLVLTGEKTVPKLKEEDKKRLSWRTQAGKILSSFV